MLLNAAKGSAAFVSQVIFNWSKYMLSWRSYFQFVLVDVRLKSNVDQMFVVHTDMNFALSVIICVSFAS